jgi:hypothetical protein
MVTSHNLEGNLTVTESGSFIFDVYIGLITGTAQQEGTTYILSNLSGAGIFENSTLNTGMLDLDNETLQISGTYIDAIPIEVLGTTAVNLAKTLQMVRDALDKSSVWFTHNELCNPTITINGLVLEDLGAHYVAGGFCSEIYGGPEGQFGSNSLFPVDGLNSKLWCNTATVWDPIEETYVSTLPCASAQFVVNKNTEYTYTVLWENGEKAQEKQKSFQLK